MFIAMILLLRRVLFSAGSFGRVNDYGVLGVNIDELVVTVDLRRCFLIVDMSLWAHVRERPKLVAGSWRRQLEVLLSIGSPREWWKLGAKSLDDANNEQ
jgi:hypothetical protein